MIATAEWISVNGDRMKVDVGVAALSLVRGATIVVPDWKFCEGEKEFEIVWI